MLKIISILGALGGLILGIYTAIKDNPNNEVLSYFISTILIIQAIPAFINILQDKKVKLDEEDHEKLREEIKSDMRAVLEEFHHDKNLYLNGLPETENPILRENLEKAVEQLKRVAAIDKARERVLMDMVDRQKLEV